MGEYVDRTGTDQKPDPMNNVFLEFPFAMEAVAAVTAFGARKHAPRGWRSFKPAYAIKYHHSKIGRHLIARETEGDINETDGGCDHMAAVAWNALACLEHIIRRRRGLSMDDLPKPLPVPPVSYLDGGPPPGQSIAERQADSAPGEPVWP